jgi:hypothetical protein
MNFSELKKQSGKNFLEVLSQELNKIMASESNKEDERFWQPSVDKAGNGYAVIRFLPPPPNETLPFVRIWEHAFKGPTGKWYIEKSLTTLGQNDPVSDYNTRLWNSTNDDESPARKQARAQRRKLVFISNVYILNDQNEPENNGKVKLFRYGKKIFEKINEKMNPQFADEEPINPFDLWTGANFKLKVRTVEGYRNYDKSEFAKPGPLFDDDQKLEAIWKQEHSLQQFVDPSTFKSYDELQRRLNEVLNLNVNTTTPPVTPKEVLQTKLINENMLENNVEEDEDLAYFRSLVN